MWRSVAKEEGAKHAWHYSIDSDTATAMTDDCSLHSAQQLCHDVCICQTVNMVNLGSWPSLIEEIQNKY